MWLTYVLTPYLKGKTHGVPATIPELNLPFVHHRGVVDTAAAPTQSNTQAAVNNLSKKGRTACAGEKWLGSWEGGKGDLRQTP